MDTSSTIIGVMAVLIVAGKAGMFLGEYAARRVHQSRAAPPPDGWRHNPGPEGGYIRVEKVEKGD